MAKQDDLEKLIASVVERFNVGRINFDQAKEEMQALIMASETVGELELAHNAFDNLAE